MRHATVCNRCLRNAAIAATVSFTLAMLAACSLSRIGAYSTPSEHQRNPLEAQRLTQKAAAQMNEEPDSAESLLREALRADLYHGPAHNNLGVLLLKKKDLYGAANEFEWARKLMPGHPDPRVNLALTLERAGRTDEAMKTYEAALDVYPGYMPAIEAVTRLLVRRGSGAGADRHMTYSEEELRANLSEIAMRGSSERWRRWATEQLAKGDR